MWSPPFVRAVGGGDHNRPPNRPDEGKTVMPDIVYSNCAGSSRDPNTGLIVRLVANEPWHASDPFVAAMPHLFSTVPTVVRGTVTAPKGKKRGVEQATASPGELRA